MTVTEAENYIGKTCKIIWRDRFGREQEVRTYIYKLGYVPLYGTYILGDTEDVFLTKVVKIQPLD